jgi:hypothetical protein
MYHHRSILPVFLHHSVIFNRSAAFILHHAHRQVLELLLSQERVISLLYDRALPPRMSFGGFGGIADIVSAGESAPFGSVSSLWMLTCSDA